MDSKNLTTNILIVVFILSGFKITYSQQKGNPVDYVNPFIGTTNFGTTNPGAIVPRGMVSVVLFNVSGSDKNKWELNSTETHVMEGDPAIPVIVDTYLKGLDRFDIEAAYSAMFKSATTKGAENKLRPDIDFYLEKGYVPYTEEFDNSVSQALEYYIADWNLAQFAKALGKEKDHKRFLKQSLRYAEYFDKDEFQMIRPRLKDGRFYKDFDPKQGVNFEPSPGFHEGNAYQYTFCVPHDVYGLMKLMGGKLEIIK